MKVYNSRRNPELIDFIGRDVWVKCVYGDTYTSYFRFLNLVKHTSTTWIGYNEMPDSFVDDGDAGMLSEEDLASLIDEIYYAPIEHFELVRPLELMSPEEVEELVNNYEGTPFD